MRCRNPSPRGRRWERLGIAVLVALSLGALGGTGIVLAHGSKGQMATASAPPPPCRAALGGCATPHAHSSSPALGLYVGPGQLAEAVTIDQQFEGRAHYVLDFLSDQSWSTIGDPGWLARAWRGGPFRMIVGVPMLPATGATLSEGATGAYDAVFAGLAAALVREGLANAVLMIGWQPDDPGQPWYVSTPAAARAYVRYWDDIRATMARVRGASFVFEWDAGDAAGQALSPAATYPGDAAVDVVATDAFDAIPTGVRVATRWSYVLERRGGPAWMRTFATSHHKPMAIAMWGVAPKSAGGAGDDARFVTHVLGWARANRVEMCVLWDYGAWAMTDGSYPRAQSALWSVMVAPRASLERRATDAPETPRTYVRARDDRAVPHRTHSG